MHPVPNYSLEALRHVKHASFDPRKRCGVPNGWHRTGDQDPNNPEGHIWFNWLDGVPIAWVNSGGRLKLQFDSGWLNRMWTDHNEFLTDRILRLSLKWFFEFYGERADDMIGMPKVKAKKKGPAPGVVAAEEPVDLPQVIGGMGTRGNVAPRGNPYVAAKIQRAHDTAWARVQRTLRAWPHGLTLKQKLVPQERKLQLIWTEVE